MKKFNFIVSALVALVLLATACGTPATPTPAPTAVPPTEAPAPTATTALVGASVMLGKNDTLGSFLVDDAGMSLYLFTKDTPNTSNCYDKCEVAWPPLLTDGAPVATDGIDASMLGTTTRKDGSMQVTYNGWPLYYYEKDTKAGDVVGQDVGGVWYLIDAAGAQVVTPAAAVAPGTIVVAKDDKLGSFLVDAKGMSLYLFTKDTPNTSACYDKCATAWPPLLATDAPVAGEGVDAALIATTDRTDGNKQVTYNGWPLYYYQKDTKAGDVTGQDVGDVWFLINPAGAQVKTPGPATVMLGKNDKLGSILVDDKGMTLYLFTKDTPNTSTCYDKCAVAWPPLLTNGDPVIGDGADNSKIGTTTRTDGTVQVTYNGWPLYYYQKDVKAGDITGQGVGEVWYVLSRDGEEIMTMP